MIKWMIKRFIADYTCVDSPSVRMRYGVLSGVLGIFCNLILFLMKLAVGVLTNSIAILADAFNNFTDMGASLIAVISACLSNRKADADHPLGHGRFEYVSALMIAFIILLVGVELLKESIVRIFEPQAPMMTPWAIVVLVFSLIVKLWMYAYNRYIGHYIGSAVNLAVSRDSLNDFFATTVILLAVIMGQCIDFPVDAIAGAFLAVYIMKSGYEVARDTVDVLLGKAPSEESVQNLKSILLSDSRIQGAHDLMIHDYGPGYSVASVHVEVSGALSFIEVHDIIDRLENRIRQELDIDMVIHVDPVGKGLDTDVPPPSEDILKKRE